MAFLLSEIANKAFLLRPDGTALMVRDAGISPGHEKMEGYWDVPGGRMDDHERSVRVALARELEEEIGYTLLDEQEMILIDTHLHVRANGTFNHLHYYVVPVAQDTEVRLSDEHDEYRWIPIMELSTLENNNHQEATEALLKWFVKNRG